ncbi:MAG TPA: hypothetical protein DET40_05515 [Lentisphaeria bacterium]|nr:MAG: hypothetical protein A2X45_12255 [Lentisphaerae bacterium GWF2_50_93]HCE42985.1 hypothetical protein [Lentisphaeria bacterium]
MKFAPQIMESQLPGHCGPCSLSSCLYILGIEATQRGLAKASGSPYVIFEEGINEHKIKKAADAYGVTSKYLMITDKEKGDVFTRKLLAHLKKGLPAILCCQDFAHWVAVIGYVDEKEKYIVIDPNDKKSTFSRYSNTFLKNIAWNDNKGDEKKDPSQYFAILLQRKDGNPPQWRVSEAWIRLCESGSEDTADNMANDLIEIARRTVPNGNVGNGKCRKAGLYMTQILDKYEDMIIDAVDHWIASEKVTKANLRSFYDDYKVVAASTGIKLPKGAAHAAIVAQITTLLTTYAWRGAL